MSNLKEALAQDFIFLHGDKKYSKEHQFIAYERSRNETQIKRSIIQIMISWKYMINIK